MGMTHAKAIRILNVMIGDKKSALKNVSRYRWSKTQKALGVKLMQEDIDALEMAKAVLRENVIIFRNLIRAGVKDRTK